MRQGGIAACAGCLAFFAALSVAAALPDSIYAFVFCRVPAWVAASYFHAGLEGASLTLGNGRVVAVTRACGGSDFFALVCGVLTWHAVRRNVTAARLLLLWLAGWGFTVLVNGMRVVVSVWSHAVSTQVAPARFFGAVHLVSGVLVFFPALVFVWWLCGRHDSGCKAADCGKRVEGI